MALDLRTPAALPLQLQPAAPAAPAAAAGGEERASFLSHVTYAWVNPLFAKANTKGETLGESDLLPLRAMDSPGAVSARFEALLAKHTALKAANPVTAALWEQFRAPMIVAGFCACGLRGVEGGGWGAPPPLPLPPRARCPGRRATWTPLLYTPRLFCLTPPTLSAPPLSPPPLARAAQSSSPPPR